LLACDDVVMTTSASGGGDDDVIPHSFLCPITQSIFVDPVIASDGFSYERSAIERWFRTSDKSPVTGMKITRLIFPNHSLRGAIDELFPEKVLRTVTSSSRTDTEQMNQSSDVPLSQSFIKSREEIETACKARFPSPPTPGTLYYGIFEQQFVRGDDVAKSRWTVRFEVDSLDDHAMPVALTATLAWRKHAQLFEPNIEAFTDHDFATRLLNTVGGTFVCKIRGTFCDINGTLNMHTYEGTNVGFGYYRLMLGADTLDGCFFLPDLDDVGNPSAQGMGMMRLLLHRETEMVSEHQL
jgi:U-box domain